MQVEEITSKKKWEDFLTSSDTAFYPLFQSWNWAETQSSQGVDIFRIGVSERGKLLALSLIVYVKAKRARFLHLRHGPVITTFSAKVFDYMIEEVKKIAQKKNASFLRISPVIQKDNVEDFFFKKRGFLPAPIHNMDAELCWVLDISKTEEELLASMRKTHRYLIKKAMQLPIEMLKAEDTKQIPAFLSMYRDLSKRKNFIPHKGVKEELEIFGKDHQANLILARYDGKLIAGAVILFVGDMAVYHHGATDYSYKDIPVSYLIQWEAIKEAKRRGKLIYNFWGIAPDTKKNHPWQGHTLFKTGFGGRKIELVHAQDLPLTPFYWKNYLIEFIRKKVKGY